MKSSSIRHTPPPRAHYGVSFVSIGRKCHYYKDIGPYVPSLFGEGAEAYQRIVSPTFPQIVSHAVRNPHPGVFRQEETKF